jgi:quinol-cytochrome oxidoreductase complex cytochrome b subunit
MARKDHPFYPHHVIEQVIQLFLLVTVLFAVTLWLPAGLEEKADPVNTPAHVKPEWYFLAVYQLLKLVPRTLGILGSGLFVVFLLALPYVLDRDPQRRRPRQRTLMVFGGVAVIVWFIAFTVWGHFS